MVVLLALAAALIAAALVGVAIAASGGDGAGTGYRNPRAHVAARIPAGWRAILRPINDITYPPQVLAAASYRVTVPRHPRNCYPRRVLAQMPADAALVQVFEYAPRVPSGKPVRVPHLPPRPRRFSYRDAEYGSFECAGPSYSFTFEQGGRAFQASVWFDRATVDPTRRAQALRILDSFHPTGGSKG